MTLACRIPRPIIAPLTRAIMGCRQGASFYAGSLYALGEGGLWYEPRDLTSAFQDSAGTVPVTAVEQPVGRRNDKSGRGNHATQSSAPARPVPSARVNLLTKTDQFADAWWAKNNVTVTDNAAAAPNGTITATRIVPTATTAFHRISSGSMVGAIASPYTYSLWAKNDGLNFIRVRMVDGAGGADAYINLTTGAVTAVGGTGGAFTATAAENGYWRIVANRSAGATNLLFSPDLSAASGDDSYFAGNTSNGILVWRPQTEGGITPTPYQRVNTATDYATSGFAHFEKYDGVDDSLATTTGGGATSAFFLCQGVKLDTFGTALATPVNAAFATATTGGTLAAATYSYRVAAKNSMGRTLASTATTQVTTGTTSTVTVNWGAVTGAGAGFDIFGRVGGSELLIGSVAAGVLTFVDTGAVTPAGALPATNTTAYSTIWSDKGTNTGYAVRVNSVGQVSLRAGNGTLYTAVTTAASVSLGVPFIFCAMDDGVNLSIQINGGTTATIARPVVVAGTAAITTARDNGGTTGWANAGLYASVYIANDIQSPAQIASTRAYIAKETGVTL